MTRPLVMDVLPNAHGLANRFHNLLALAFASQSMLISFLSFIQLPGKCISLHQRPAAETGLICVSNIARVIVRTRSSGALNI